jgi:hypothetical protein
VVDLKLQKNCKPGGCSTWGCEGGRYCFNEDGTPKVISPEQQARIDAFLKTFFNAED